MSVKFVHAAGSEGYGVYRVEWTDDGPMLEHAPDAEAEGVVAPGFVDVHIHGAYGVDFMSASRAEFDACAERLAETGYEAFFPTTVSCSAEEVLAAFDKWSGHPMVPGFHLEGPFISPDYPGAQPPSAIQPIPIKDSAWDAVFDHPGLRIITLAPELEGALPLIKRLSERGVRVSLGHTGCTSGEAGAALDAGAVSFTHTFNAMCPFHHREVGPVGVALFDDRAWTELIYDRMHVSMVAAALLAQMKPEGKLVAVSDGTMAAGLAPGARLQMWGLDCVVGEGDVRIAETGALAGSAITLLEAFQYIAVDGGIDSAIWCCCLNPRDLAGLTNPPAVWLEFDLDFNLRQVRRFHDRAG